MKDLRAITDSANLGDTWPYSERFFIYELYDVLGGNLWQAIILAAIAILVLVLLLTMNLPVALFVLLCVAVVEVAVLGIGHFWSFDMNLTSLTVNLIAIVLAIDYTVHIGRAYLLVACPDKYDNG